MMLDQSTRTAILRLREQGHGSRAIADALGISRGAVKKVLRTGSADVPRMQRAERGEAHREAILQLYVSCKGNLIRVHEELIAKGAFCRRHSIGLDPVKPVGHYEFEPGEEMQHDTSPHVAKIAGRQVDVQTAGLVLAYSRMRFVQCYPRFTRFTCKLFLTEAIQYFGGSCSRCMIDNTHVVVQSGTGREMIPAPEMEAFGDRFGFEFEAHERGDANRSAHVERSFDYVENNFLAGREFADWDDLQAEARRWSDKVNAKYRTQLHASPRELFAIEQTKLKPLPIHVPDVYLLHDRIVDTEGFVNVQRNRYSVPWQLIGRRMEVRESKDRIEIFDGPRMVASHRRVQDPIDARVIDPQHRPPRGSGADARKALTAEEKRLIERAEELAAFIDLMKRRGEASVRAMRMLRRLVDDYPRDALVIAIAEAVRYGMTDLDRLERMVLRGIARDFFPTRHRPDSDEDI
jgi:transposase